MSLFIHVIEKLLCMFLAGGGERNTDVYGGVLFCFKTSLVSVYFW